MDLSGFLRQTRAANGSDAISQEALAALPKAALKVAEEAVPAPDSKPDSESEPGANLGEQEDIFLAVAPRNAVKNTNRACALFHADDLEKTQIGKDIFPESPVQLTPVKGGRPDCQSFGALLPTSKHSLHVKFPIEGLKRKHPPLTDEEYAQLKDRLVPPPSQWWRPAQPNWCSISTRVAGSPSTTSTTPQCGS
ncbi:hypothetical protein BKA56DRAFT_667220 [Ilyonectria sp. MPI-CAGE-AT-0026]|nr:hypothetical protein BKA56DRAFT_667220 [Ilyonectria sp. MPI-CAGE-AT-0026]